jgi:hypothetical protein
MAFFYSLGLSKVAHRVPLDGLAVKREPKPQVSWDLQPREEARKSIVKQVHL